MNLPEVLMGVAAGIGILAAFSHGLTGLVRRPRDRAHIAFAIASVGAAVGALSVLALYQIDNIDLHIWVNKWMYFPATTVWTLSIVWFVAYLTGVRPKWFLRTLSAGFAFTLVANAVLPHGILHAQKGNLVSMKTIGGSVMVQTDSSAHVLQNVTDLLTLASFAFLSYVVYRVARHPNRADHVRALYLGGMTALLAAATFVDAVIEHRIVASLGRLYLSQLFFAFVIIALSLGLRRESLRVERELQLYKTHMDDLVETRVRELDEAHARLAEEEQGRRATEEVLQRRMEELDALQRIAQILAGRSTLEHALEEVTGAIAPLFQARYARVRLLRRDTEEATAPDGQAGAADERATGTRLDLELAAAALKEGAVIDGELEAWRGLTADTRRRADDEGVGVVLAAPLRTTRGVAGVLLIARDASAGPFSPAERQLARTISDGLTAVIEIDRLHREEKEQAAAEERQALARDLHDAVTQSVYSATLIAEALPAVYERDPGEGLHQLERLRRLVRAALAEMRTLLFELRPQALETAPLDALLERLGDALAGQADIEVDVQADEDLGLPADVKVALYRVTQESFSNIAKHARATAVTARVTAETDGLVTLRVTDDGRGFDPSAVRSGQMGLHIMAERLERIGGSLTVESRPGAGTTITAVWRQTASDTAALETMGA